MAEPLPSPGDLSKTKKGQDSRRRSGGRGGKQDNACGKLQEPRRHRVRQTGVKEAAAEGGQSPPPAPSATPDSKNKNQTTDNLQARNVNLGQEETREDSRMERLGAGITHLGSCLREEKVS